MSQGGRDHSSHRLVALGFSERGATLALYTVAIASGMAAVVAYHFPASIAFALLPAFVLAVVFVFIYLARVRVYQDADKARPGSVLIPTLAEFSYKRRIFEVMNDFLLIVLAYYGAFLLRFEGSWSSRSGVDSSPRCRSSRARRSSSSSARARTVGSGVTPGSPIFAASSARSCSRRSPPSARSRSSSGA